MSVKVNLLITKLISWSPDRKLADYEILTPISEPAAKEAPSEAPRKKLKWETIIRTKTGLNLEHALYFTKDETKYYFAQLEKEIEYLR